MKRSRLLAATVAVVLLSACGDDESSEPATSTSSPTSVPSTLGPVTDDLADPAAWIGHTFTASTSPSPSGSGMMAVQLDGVSTQWVMWPGCGMMDATVPPACITFVREDLGQAEPAAASWTVLSWQVSDPKNFTMGGPVFDAVSVYIDDPSLMPWGQCRSKAGDPGVYEAFVHYDPTYRPAPSATAVTPEDLAAHPVELAWTLDSQHQLVSVPAADVECVLHPYGD